MVEHSVEGLHLPVDRLSRQSQSLNALGARRVREWGLANDRRVASLSRASSREDDAPALSGETLWNAFLSTLIENDPYFDAAYWFDFVRESHSKLRRSSCWLQPERARA